MTRPIPISVGKDIAKKYGYDQVIIYARKVGDDGIEHVTTYGVDKDHCGAAAKIGNHLKYKVFGWDSELDMKGPAGRVKELREKYSVQ